VLTTSRHSQYSLACESCWIYREKEDLVCIDTTIFILPAFVNFNDVDYQYFRICIIRLNQMVERDAVVIDKARIGIILGQLIVLG
jgi:hypothetical protein